MKRVLLATALVVGLGAALLPAMAHAATATCTQTGFVRDGINLTAAQIGGPVTGTINAADTADGVPCNIGVYYDNTTSGNVTGATISGANYFGVVVNGDVGAVSVNVTNSTVSHIGESPFNGTQHGVAIYYRAFGGSATGTISGNSVSLYQKGGITANGNVSATITNNTVNGLGVVTYIAQNGIQLAYGAKGTVSGNAVSGNAYSAILGLDPPAGEASSGGILVVGGPCYSLPSTVGLSITKNTLTNNDVGVWLFNANAACNGPVAIKTNNVVKFNTISDDAVTNTNGYNATCGYQAGISDVGHKDLIVNNKVSGTGYTPNRNCGDGGTPNAFVRAIDLDSSARGAPSNK
jgi:hypothetical protein